MICGAGAGKGGERGVERGGGVATAPVIDNKGNIYVGLSNVPANSGGVGSGGISSIEKKESNAAKSNTQMQYRSWREKRN